MMPKFKITIEETSNPKILKFGVDSLITDQSSHEYNNIEEASGSPLAQQLFHLPFVKKVYITGHFIAIERFDILEWNEVQQEVASQIEEYLNNDGVVIENPTSQKIPVTIYAESTPNPAVVKFVANKRLVSGLVEFTSIDEAQISPLAAELFHFPFVKGVFMDENYISITKFEMAEWEDITMELRQFIKTFLEDGKTVLGPDATNQSLRSKQIAEVDFENLDDISKEIVNILDQYVKPAVASDGGHIQFESYDPETKNVRVILQGACSGCPSSTFTLKNGIENMLKEMLKGKVETVEAING